MKHSLKEEIQKHKLLLICFAISVILLIVFLIFQNNRYDFLDLEIKWLIVCGIPILIGLFIGGYIKSFKGFGVELESNLKEPIPSSIVSKIDIAESPGMQKETLENLFLLSETEKNRINRLRFVYGRTHYYDTWVVRQHLLALKNLKFLEIVNEDGNFQYLLPLKKFKVENEFSTGLIQQFITGVEQRNLKETFPDVVSDYVLTTDSIIEVYKKITASQQSKILFQSKEMLPILNKDKKFIGTVDKQRIEARISEEVVKTIS